MEVTSGAAAPVSVLPSELPSTQAQPVVEHQLFDYLVEIEKSLGGAGRFADPSTLIGAAFHSLEGIAQQAQKAFNDANAGLSAGTGGSFAESMTAQVSPQDGAAGPDGNGAGETVEQNAILNLDRAISVMWAAANVSIAINGLSAATSSANTLIKQQ
jgi:hypothetical protein